MLAHLCGRWLVGDGARESWRLKPRLEGLTATKSACADWEPTALFRVSTDDGDHGQTLTV